MENFTVYDTSQWETRGIVVHHDAGRIEHRLVDTPQGVVKDTGDGKLIMVGRGADSRILKLGCDAFTSQEVAVEIVKTKRKARVVQLIQAAMNIEQAPIEIKEATK